MTNQRLGKIIYNVSKQEMISISLFFFLQEKGAIQQEAKRDEYENQGKRNPEVQYIANERNIN